MVAFCAEFPNDNPALHDGAIFVVTTVDGQWVIERPSAPRSIEVLTAVATIASNAASNVVEAPAEMAAEAAAETPVSPTALYVLEPVLGGDDEGDDDEGDGDEGFEDIDDHHVLETVATAMRAHGVEALPDTDVDAVVVAEPEPTSEPLHADPSVVAEETAPSVVAAEIAPRVAEAPAPVADAAMEESLGEVAVEEWDYSEWQGTLLEGPPVALAPLESAVVMTATAIAAEEELAVASAEEEELVVEPLEPFVPTETYTTSELPPASDDPFATFVMAIADACLASQELSVAALLPALLFRGRVEPGQADDDAVRALVATGVLEPDGDAWVVGARLGGEVEGWKAILRGTSDDLGPCGPLALDEWSAHLAALLCAKPEKETALRREIRSRGVAAFGLVEAAA